MQVGGGIKDAEHWGPYGPQYLDPRDLPPRLKQMQPTGLDEQVDEGRRRALEAATVARAEGQDWSSIAQYLRESPVSGPLCPEERLMAERMRTAVSRHNMTAQPFNTDMHAFFVYRAENFERVTRTHPGLMVGSWE